MKSFKNRIENFKFGDTSMKYTELINKIGYKSLSTDCDNRLSSGISKKASSGFISQYSINKVIEDLNSYSNDNIVNLNNFDNFKNNPGIMQIYSV